MGKERDIEARERLKDEQYKKEVDLRVQKEILSENMYHLRFYEKQIKTGKSVLKSNQFEEGLVPIDMLLQSAYKIRQAIQNGMMILKYKHNLKETEIAKIMEDCKNGLYNDFLTI